MRGWDTLFFQNSLDLRETHVLQSISRQEILSSLNSDSVPAQVFISDKKKLKQLGTRAHQIPLSGSTAGGSGASGLGVPK